MIDKNPILREIVGITNELEQLLVAIHMDSNLAASQVDAIKQHLCKIRLAAAMGIDLDNPGALGLDTETFLAYLKERQDILSGILPFGWQKWSQSEIVEELSLLLSGMRWKSIRAPWSDTVVQKEVLRTALSIEGLRLANTEKAAG